MLGLYDYYEYRVKGFHSVERDEVAEGEPSKGSLQRYTRIQGVRNDLDLVIKETLDSFFEVYLWGTEELSKKEVNRRVLELLNKEISRG
jgi:hypothetical protein